MVADLGFFPPEPSSDFPPGTSCRTRAVALKEAGGLVFWMEAHPQGSNWKVRLKSKSKDEADGSSWVRLRTQNQLQETEESELSLDDAMAKLHKFQMGHESSPLPMAEPDDVAKDLPLYTDMLKDEAMAISRDGYLARYKDGQMVYDQGLFNEDDLKTACDVGKAADAAKAAEEAKRHAEEETRRQAAEAQRAKLEQQMASLPVFPGIEQMDPTLRKETLPVHVVPEQIGNITYNLGREIKRISLDNAIRLERAYGLPVDGFHAVQGGFCETVSNAIYAALEENKHGRLAGMAREQIQLARRPLVERICANDNPQLLARLISHIGTLDQKYHNTYLFKDDQVRDEPVFFPTLLRRDSAKTLAFIAQHEPHILLNEIQSFPLQFAACVSEMLQDEKSEKKCLTVLMSLDRRPSFDHRIKNTLLVNAIDLNDLSLFNFAIANGANQRIDNPGSMLSATLYFRAMMQDATALIDRVKELGVTKLTGSYSGSEEEPKLFEELLASGRDAIVAQEISKNQFLQTGANRGYFTLCNKYGAVQTFNALLEDPRYGSSITGSYKGKDHNMEKIWQHVVRMDNVQIANLLIQNNMMPSADTLGTAITYAGPRMFMLLYKAGCEIQEKHTEMIQVRGRVDLQEIIDNLPKALAHEPGIALESVKPKPKHKINVVTPS